MGCQKNQNKTNQNKNKTVGFILQVANTLDLSNFNIFLAIRDQIYGRTVHASCGGMLYLFKINYFQRS